MATFLSTPSARRATRQDGGHHARQHISIHALREEGDAVPPCPISPSWTFLSTPSARRATVLPAPSSAAPFWHFYPRPPRGGRPIVHTDTRDAKNFYPRPPRGGRRTNKWTTKQKHSHFYPRPPRGGRPQHELVMFAHRTFLSTPSARRATRGGSAPRLVNGYFYPRPPRGGRPPELRIL